MIIEPVAAEADGCQIESTNEILALIDKLNIELANGSILKPSVVNINVGSKEGKKSMNESNVKKSLKTVNKKSFVKNDIRSYGVSGVKTENEIDNKEAVKSQVEQIRSSKPSSGVIPDIGERMRAGRLIDKLYNDEAIVVSEPEIIDTKIQKDGMTIVGSDVVSLFPSLKNIESARLARHAVLQSKVEFSNIDYLKALRYIHIVGGRDLLSRAGLSRISPVWRGKRGDLITVGGEKSRDQTMWKDTNKEIKEFGKEFTKIALKIRKL